MLILVSALLSGLLATWISIWYYRREQVRQAKIAVFQQLLGNRYVLLPAPHDPAARVAFASAVNQIAIVFHDCDPALSALRAFHEAIVEPSASPDLRNKRLLELFKSLAKHLNVKTEILGENFFLQAFSVGQPALPPDFQLQALRWQDGKVIITGLVRFGAEGQWMPLLLPTELAQNVGCAFLELAAIGREREDQLRSMNAAIEVGTMSQDFLQRLARRRAANA